MELLRGPLEPVARIFGVPAGTPDIVVRWGHPFFMSFVLLVMGGTVAYQGWQIRTSNDGAAVAKARNQHPKLALAMSLFFAIGAFGGMGSIIAQTQPLLSRCGGSVPALAASVAPFLLACWSCDCLPSSCHCLQSATAMDLEGYCGGPQLALGDGLHRPAAARIPGHADLVLRGRSQCQIVRSCATSCLHDECCTPIC